MQIKNRPRNLYRFYAWSRSRECLDGYRRQIEDSVRRWESLRSEGVSLAKCAEFTGISRATFYRRRTRLHELARGIVPPSKAPRQRNKPRWGECEKQLVFEIRCANKTLGKAKIGAVLRRDHVTCPQGSLIQNESLRVWISYSSVSVWASASCAEPSNCSSARRAFVGVWLPRDECGLT